MKTRAARSIAAMALVAALGGAGCGYFLHPERRGNTSNVDTGTMVMDLLWLLPGIIPGVVALIVDFSSGAIYTGHGGMSGTLVLPSGHMSQRFFEDSGY